MIRLSLLPILILATGILSAQPVNHSQLTIETIMQKTEFWRGAEPSEIVWGTDNQTLYFNWNPEKDTLSSLYRITLKDLTPAKVSREQKSLLPERGISYDLDYRRAAYVRKGDIFILDLKKNIERQLTAFAGRESAPTFSTDGHWVNFQYNQNLFRVNTETGLMEQMTEFVTGEERVDRKKQGQAQWLENQQMELFEVLQEKKAIQKARDFRQTGEEENTPLKIYLGKERAGNMSMSPSGNFIAYTTFNQGGGDPTSVTHFVTESGYTEEQAARTKVGSPVIQVKLFLYDRLNRKVMAVKTDSLPGITDLPDFWADYPDRKPAPDKVEPRQVSLSVPIWNMTHDQAIVIARSHDNKDRWICILNAVDGKLTSVDRQRDEAWIAGPGISGFGGSTGWMADNRTIWFQTEETGYSHLVLLDTENGQKRALTSGPWEVYEPFLSIDKQYFYFTANKKHPGIRHFYRIPVTGGEPVQITNEDGGHEITISPDEKWLAFRHSTGNQPWELFILENKPGASPRKITHSTTPEFEAYKWRMPEYITFNAEDGATVHARLYRPDQPKEQGPAVIFVHGAGYLQNAHQWWSSYFREYMFHNFLADNGYTVLDIDYRGSSGYGRDWRTGIYRHMGGKDLSDHVDGARYLIEKHKVSPAKIGIYGGSYGGFITLMAMFNHPDLFSAGAALRAVTDWAHYNHGYTANILNTPVEDSIAYRRSSPIYFADGLRGALLMCHGMVDDNVQFQDIIRLTQRLIELGKENWELAVYPVESHGFTEPSSWVDEYKRIYKLFDETLK